jgi:hypothetical protein
LLRVRPLAFLFALTSTALAVNQQASIAQETVVVPSGKLHLKAFLWKPAGPGPFPQFFFVMDRAALTRVKRLGSRLRKLPKDLPHCF